MSYSRVKTPKFYIDTALLARKLGYIKEENLEGKHYLNPIKTSVLSLDGNFRRYLNITFKSRYFLNPITHCFFLGHRFFTDNLTLKGYIVNSSGAVSSTLFNQTVDTNGFTKLENLAGVSKDLDAERFTVKISNESDDVIYPTFSIGDLSAGWSYEMPHSPDLELTQTFLNESVTTQTTKSGYTLTDSKWTKAPRWGEYPQWRRSSNDIEYPFRRSWNLKFSYLNDTDLMPQYYTEQDSISSNRGLFERIVQTDPNEFNIKQDFLSKVLPTINLGLPFIFQPDKDVEEYAICRANANSITFNQVSHRIYDVSLDIIETW